MKTPACFQASFLRRALFLALLLLPGGAFSAAPPNPAPTDPPPAKHGLFARLGNALSRLSERPQRPAATPAAGTKAGAARKSGGQAGEKPNARDRAENSDREPAGKHSEKEQEHEEKPARKGSKSPDEPKEASDDEGKKPKSTATTGDAAAKVYPLASFVRYGVVRCPFPPYNTLDVSGMQSGSLAKDPVTGKVFRVP